MRGCFGDLVRIYWILYRFLVIIRRSSTADNEGRGQQLSRRDVSEVFNRRKCKVISQREYTHM